MITCTDPGSFVRGGPFLTFFFFLVDEGREDPNTTTIAGQPALRWCAEDGPTLNSGLVAL